MTKNILVISRLPDGEGRFFSTRAMKYENSLKVEIQSFYHEYVRIRGLDTMLIFLYFYFNFVSLNITLSVRPNPSVSHDKTILNPFLRLERNFLYVLSVRPYYFSAACFISSLSRIPFIEDVRVIKCKYS